MFNYLVSDFFLQHPGTTLAVYEVAGKMRSGYHVAAVWRPDKTIIGSKVRTCALCIVRAVIGVQFSSELAIKRLMAEYRGVARLGPKPLSY